MRNLSIIYVFTLKIIIMKNLLLIISFFTFLSTAKAQLVSDKFTVHGKCGMCKKTIETAALSSGVKSANWQKDKQMIEVEYDSANVSISKVKKAIADAGYDNDTFKATDESYGNLPECCQYRTAKAACAPGKEKCKKGKKCCKKSDQTKSCCTSSCDKSKPCCAKTDGAKCEKDAASCCKKGEAGKGKCCKE